MVTPYRNTPLCSEFYVLQDDLFLSHKFAFSNLRFPPFYEHFRQLREKYTTTVKNKVHHVNQLIEPDLMMYIYITFIKIFHDIPLDATPLNYSKYSSRC